MLNNRMKVKARSCTEVGIPTITSSQTEEEFLDTVGGRYVSTQVNPQLLRAWLRQCESEHGEACMPSSRFPMEKHREAAFRPTFVIDVIQSCLVDTPSQCRYVALSYVWGKAPVFRHLLENTRDLRKTSSFRSLPIPATIRDAITLVHAIGERYLWVDSLCIVQNNLKMQRAEITRMGSIYSRALFTIIAAAGDHANSGLPGVERGSREQVQKILKLADCELLTVIDTTPQAINDTIWAERGWTFQERVLSKRVLVFSGGQAYWNCRVASHSEERAFEEVRDIEWYSPSFSEQAGAECLSWEPLQRLEYCSIYHQLLYGYRQRHLTHQTDILNAFNGISEILGALQDDTSHWGLPESIFSYALTWSYIGPSSRNHIEVPIFDANGSKQMIPIPSWSWAAWSGEDPTRLPSLSVGCSDDVRPVIHFDIVDEKHQLVRIKDRPSQDHPGAWIPTSWKDGQPHWPQCSESISQIGRLRFWTSLANLRVVRKWRPQNVSVASLKNIQIFQLWEDVGVGEESEDTTPAFVLFPSFDFQPDTKSIHEITHQDFVVVAAYGTGLLVLLAVEWRDGIAYRVGIVTDIEEALWLRVENREWRLITLG